MSTDHHTCPEEPTISVCCVQYENGTNAFVTTATSTVGCTTIAGTSIMRQTVDGGWVMEKRPMKIVTTCKAGKVEEV